MHIVKSNCGENVFYSLKNGYNWHIFMQSMTTEMWLKSITLYAQHNSSEHNVIGIEPLIVWCMIFIFSGSPSFKFKK